MQPEDYSIPPNASTNITMKRLEKPQPLWHQLDQILAKHFRPQDAKAILQLLRQEHEERLQQLSLEALEQLACCLLAEQQSMKPAEEPQDGVSEIQQKGEGGDGEPRSRPESLALTRARV
ncbi:ubiquitin-like protein 4B [Thomomys bottae]